MCSPGVRPGDRDLRYFNVYGPRQRPDSAYAAVIPLFIAAFSAGQQPILHGDGRTEQGLHFRGRCRRGQPGCRQRASRSSCGRVFNIACGGSHSLLELLDVLGGEMGVSVAPVHTEPRPGDIRASQADVTAARQVLGFEAKVSFEEGLRRTVAWYRAVSGSPGL